MSDKTNPSYCVDELRLFLTEVRNDIAMFDSERLVDQFSSLLEELQVTTEELQVQNEILELAQRQSEIDRQKYQELFDYSPDGYLVTDFAGKIEEVNESASEMLGVSTNHLRMKPLTVFVEKADRPHFFKILSELASGEVHRKVDFEITLTPRGREPFVAAVSIRAGKAIKGLSGPVLRWTLRDITARFEQEHKLAQQSKSLLEKNAELEQWAAVTAHDLKEPVRVMALYSELLREKYESVLEGDGETYLTFISMAASKGLSLIQDLLTFHTLGSRTSCVKKLKLSGPLNDAIEGLQPALRECGGVIVCEKMPTATADSAQMVQLFTNLLSNAIKFRSPDRKLIIKVGATKEADRWVVLVQDNGIGFDMEYAARIFVLFERLNSAEDYQGNGIWLALCKKIVDNHGGNISAISYPNEGTTIRFTLPVGTTRSGEYIRLDPP